MNPFREILRRGVEMAAGVRLADHRARPDGGIAAFENHHDPGQRLSREEAIRVLDDRRRPTGPPGRTRRGSLEPGKHADLAAFDEDLFLAADPRSARPVLTVSLGRDVFAS